MTLYNHEKYIEEALHSAIDQSIEPTEIVVIDDHSTDGSVAAARRVQHKTIRVLAEQTNLGGPTTVKGLLQCRGDFIAILNSDDHWDPRKLELQVEYLERTPTCGAVFTRVKLIDESGDLWRPSEHPLSIVFNSQNRSRSQWLRKFFDDGNAFCVSSAVIRRECFDRLGPLDGRYVQLQDFEMWMRIASAGMDLHVIDEPLTYYRVSRRHTNLSASTVAVRRRVAYEYCTLLRHLWKVKTATALSEIFPEEECLPQTEDLLATFCLARIAMKRNTSHHAQFAVDTLFEAARDRSCMELAASRFGFGAVEYREFLAHSPIASAQENRMLFKAKMLLADKLPYSILAAMRAAKSYVTK